MSIGESNSEIEVEASPEFYADNSYPRGPAQCVALPLPQTDGISTNRMSVLPNTKCPIPYYIGPPIHGSTPARIGSVASSGSRLQWYYQMPLSVILMWLLSVCWLIAPMGDGFWAAVWPAADVGQIRDKVKVAGGKEKEEDECNRRCWLISWPSSSLPGLLLMFSSITTCCWRTQLLTGRVARMRMQMMMLEEVVVIKPVRTLKCQLLKVGKLLHLIRNYYLIRDLTPLTRKAAQNNEEDERVEDFWNGGKGKEQEQPQTKTTPPLLLLLPQTLMPTISSSQSSLKDTQDTCKSNNMSSGRRSNSNAKTVVRWGTIVVVSLWSCVRRSWRLLVHHRTYILRITNCCWPSSLLTNTRRRMSRAVRWRFVTAASRIVCICKWLICRIGGGNQVVGSCPSGGGGGVRLVDLGAFINRRHRRRGGEGVCEKGSWCSISRHCNRRAGGSDGNRLGLIET